MTRGELIKKPIDEEPTHKSSPKSDDLDKTKSLTLDKLKLAEDGMAEQRKAFQNDAINSKLAKQVEGLVDEFDHVTFWVGNAKHSASFYMSHFGFQPYAFRGLETGYRKSASHVVKLGQTVIQFVSAVEPNDKEMGDFLASHGDAVKDVAFRVRNIEALVERAEKAEAEIVSKIVSENIDGLVIKRATIRCFGDVTHTFIERHYDYDREGRFLPGYTKPSLEVSKLFYDIILLFNTSNE